MSSEERRGDAGNERADLVEGLRAARDEARLQPDDRVKPGSYATALPGANPLPPLEAHASEALPRSPDRESLNRLWNVADGAAEPGGAIARLFSPLRGPLRRLARFALGPVVDRQVEMNSAQVRFDNELVRYADDRFDRMSRHYDRVLGLHGRRMEEIDERHLILQQELIRHVHDLVARIELVFEAAEQNHLYLEGTLRETREELSKLEARLGALERETK
jgi:hypothetical protein